MPEPKVCKSIKLNEVLPSFINVELAKLCNDADHARKGELDKISLDTQTMIANALRETYDKDVLLPSKSFTPSIPIPIGLLDIPGKMTLRIWPKDVTDLSKGTKGVMLNYEIVKW